MFSFQDNKDETVLTCFFFYILYRSLGEDNILDSWKMFDKLATGGMLAKARHNVPEGEAELKTDIYTIFSSYLMYRG